MSRFASPLASNGASVTQSSSRRPARASWPLSVGPPSARTLCAPGRAERAYGTVEVDVVLAGDDHLGDVRGSLPICLRSRRHGQHDRPLGRSREEGRVPVELAGARHDCDRRNRCLASLAARVLDRRREQRRTVVLALHRCGCDQNNVGERTQDAEQRFVGRSAERAGHTVPRRPTVDAHDHVQPHCRSSIVVRQVGIHREPDRRRRRARETASACTSSWPARRRYPSASRTGQHQADVKRRGG